MQVPKPERIKDRKLLTRYHNMECIICNKHGCDPAHVRSRAAGGPDKKWNLVPLCREHHTEQHKRGWIDMMLRYFRLRLLMEAMGWRHCLVTDKLWNSRLAPDKPGHDVKDKSL